MTSVRRDNLSSQHQPFLTGDYVIVVRDRVFNSHSNRLLSCRQMTRINEYFSTKYTNYN